MKKAGVTLKKVITADGTATLFVEELNEHYHSVHGAQQESLHVFIFNGMHYYITNYPARKPIRILEIGFGTGLNTLLTMVELYKYIDAKVYFDTLEPYPVSLQDTLSLNYTGIFSAKIKESYLKFHTCKWQEDIQIDNHLYFRKENVRLQDFITDKSYDIVYFDAFAPDKQPDMWTPEVFTKLYGMMCDGGILVTYCAKGQLKRTLREVGFRVEVLPGPPGKREMTRAIKNPL